MLLGVLSGWYGDAPRLPERPIPQAIALGNNDVALIAGTSDDPIADCLGFAIYRQSASQPSPTPLSAWVGLEGEANADWRPVKYALR